MVLPPPGPPVPPPFPPPAGEAPLSPTPLPGAGPALPPSGPGLVAAPTGVPLLTDLLPPAIVAALVRQLPPDVQAQFPTLPPPAQSDLLRQAFQALPPDGQQALLETLAGGPPPDGQGAGPPPLPELGGPPPLPPPVPGPPPGPPPGRPPGQPPGLPPGLPPSTRQPAAVAAVAAASMRGKQLPPVTPASPKPSDWQPEPLADLYDDSGWQDAIDYRDLLALADDARRTALFQERNDACWAQEQCYALAEDWAKLDGEPVNSLGGDLIYTLTRPAKAVDRVVARVLPDEGKLAFELRPRSDRDEYKEASQNVENWMRHQYLIAPQKWRDRIASSGLDANLYRKFVLNAALHGSCGWAIRVNVKRRKNKGQKARDFEAEQPFPWEPVPLYELYPLGDCTLRIQSVTMRELRARYAEVAKRWPRKRAGDATDGRWTPDDEHPCRLIGFSDKDGLWFALAYDLDGPGAGDHGAGWDQEETRWLVAPHRVDFGRCAYQVPPGYQARGVSTIPDGRAVTGGALAPRHGGRGAQLARGILFTDMQTYKRMSQVASATLSNTLYNAEPAGIDYINPQRDDGPPPDMATGPGAQNTRFTDERYETIEKNLTKNSDTQFTVSLLGNELSESQPSVLGGQGLAQSGYDRRQQMDAASDLHIGPLENWVTQEVAAIARFQAELYWRYGTGEATDGKLFGTLPFRKSKGGWGDAELSTDDLTLSGVGIEVRYLHEDTDRELALNNIWIPRQKEGLVSKLTAREQIGIEEPEREEDRIAEEAALNHPAMAEAEVIGALEKNNHRLLPWFLWLLAQDKAKQAAPGGSPPGPPPQLPSMPGVPEARGNSASMGLPPGQGLPPGIEIPSGQ